MTSSVLPNTPENEVMSLSAHSYFTADSATLITLISFGVSSELLFDVIHRQSVIQKRRQGQILLLCWKAIITTSQRSCGKVIVFSCVCLYIRGGGGSPYNHYLWCHLPVTGHICEDPPGLTIQDPPSPPIPGPLIIKGPVWPKPTQDMFKLVHYVTQTASRQLLFDWNVFLYTFVAWVLLCLIIHHIHRFCSDGSIVVFVTKIMQVKYSLIPETSPLETIQEWIEMSFCSLFVVFRLLRKSS